MRLSVRVQQLSPSPTLAITAKANELKQKGVDIVGLGAGEPDFNTPRHIIDAAIQAMEEGKTKYTPAAGIIELKQAICRKLQDDQGLSYDPSQITVGNGAKHILYNAFQAILNPQDEVIVPTPYWVSYPEQVLLAGGTPVFVEGKESNDFKIKPEQLRAVITEKTRALIINSPSNPTGSIYSREELTSLAELCLQNNILMISDEIYEKLIYDGAEHSSVASLNQQCYENTLVVNGMSKPYAMTGWRIGYAAGSKDLIGAMTNLSSHSTSNPTSFAQYGALAALVGTQEPLEEMKREFVLRRDRAVDLLNAIQGIHCLKPKGAFYIFANVKEAVKQSGFATTDQWAQELLYKQYVACVPGAGFGSPDHIRISYATSMAQLEKGIERIKSFVQGSK
jgi:aspartate aminotransferase